MFVCLDRALAQFPLCALCRDMEGGSTVLDSMIQGLTPPKPLYVGFAYAVACARQSRDCHALCKATSQIHLLNFKKNTVEEEFHVFCAIPSLVQKGCRLVSSSRWYSCTIEHHQRTRERNRWVRSLYALTGTHTDQENRTHRFINVNVGGNCVLR